MCSGQTLRANDPFKRFAPEVAQPVRTAQVTGDERTRIEKTRQMLRGMTAEKLLEVIEFRKGLNLFQALALAQKEGKMIVPNDIHDKILMETKDEELLEQLYKNWAWTGTLVIYKKPGKPFGKEVTFSWKDDNGVEHLTYAISH